MLRVERKIGHSYRRRRRQCTCPYCARSASLRLRCRVVQDVPKEWPLRPESKAKAQPGGWSLSLSRPGSEKSTSYCPRLQEHGSRARRLGRHSSLSSAIIGFATTLLTRTYLCCDSCMFSTKHGEHYARSRRTRMGLPSVGKREYICMSIRNAHPILLQDDGRLLDQLCPARHLSLDKWDKCTKLLWARCHCLRTTA